MQAISPRLSKRFIGFADASIKKNSILEDDSVDADSIVARFRIIRDDSKKNRKKDRIGSRKR